MKKIIFASVAILSFSAVFSQTINNAGIIKGHPANYVNIVKGVSPSDISGGAFHGGSQPNIVIGTFKDSVDLDQSAASFTVYGGGPSVMNSFVAAYDNSGNISWGFALGNATDSVRAEALYFQQWGYIYVGGKFTGTVNFNPLGGATTLTSTTGEDGFLALYDASGYLYSVWHYENTGSNASVTAVCQDAAGYVVVGGYFDGTLDADPGAGNVPVLSSGTIDAFLSYHDMSGTNYWAYPYSGSASERVVDLKGDMQGNILVAGVFTGSIDLEISSSGTPLTCAGGRDAFFAHYGSSGILGNALHFGTAGDELALGISSFGPEMTIALQFENTIDMDPYGGGYAVVSNGSSDIAIGSYDIIGGLTKNYAYSFGSSGAEVGTMYNRYDHDKNRIGVSFSGTVDADPDPAKTFNVVSSNNPVNAAMVEFDEYGVFVTAEQIEAQKLTFYLPFEFTDSRVLYGGNFSGNNVDILVYDATQVETNTPATVGFIVDADRCHMTIDAQQIGLYECGTNTATLYAATTGAIGYVDYFWGNGDYTDYNQTATGAYGDNSGSYNVSGNDAAGCFASDFIWLYNHDTIDFHIGLSVSPSMCGNDYGSAIATPVNAQGAVTYYWSGTGDLTSSTDSLEAGNYFVQVSDTFNCYVQEFFNVANSDGPTVTLNSSANVNCAGVNSGAIDINVTGGLAPYTFLWSNNSTTEDISGLAGGTYSVTVTDAAGCTNQLCTSISQPEMIYVYYNASGNADCFVNNGWIEAYAWGGSGPLTFQWDAATGSQVGDSAINLFSGLYNVTVTDSLGCSTTETFGIGDNGGPYAYVWNSAQPSCSGSVGLIEVDVILGSGSYAYQWSSGQTTEDIYNVMGDAYVLSVTDLVSGCRSVLYQWLGQQLPFPPQLCMVTVDSTGTQNVVVWDKSMNPEGDYFKIYREGVCNSSDFGLVGIVDEDSLSVFYDTVVNSDTRSWRYYVTVVDTCGFESGASEINKTIHLSANVDANGDVMLQWEQYIGFPVNYYEIYREQPANNGIYDLVDSVGSTTLNYLDTLTFASYFYTELEYYVDAIPFSTCSATKAFNQNSSRSNHTRLASPFDSTVLATPAVTPLEEEQFISIYPNPANDNVTIRINGEMMQHQVMIMNQVGQQVRQFTMNRQTMFSTSELNPGLYYIQVSAEGKQTKIFKLIIAR